MLSMEYREDKNILIGTYTNPYDGMKDSGESMAEIARRLESDDRELHYIADMSVIKVSFADLVQGLAQAFSTPGSVFANPRLKTYTIGSDEMITFGAKAVSEQEHYGKVPIKLFSSVEEALADINSQ